MCGACVYTCMCQCMCPSACMSAEEDVRILYCFLSCSIGWGLSWSWNRLFLLRLVVSKHQQSSCLCTEDTGACSPTQHLDVGTGNRASDSPALLSIEPHPQHPKLRLQCFCCWADIPFQFHYFALTSQSLTAALIGSMVCIWCLFCDHLWEHSPIPKSWTEPCIYLPDRKVAVCPFFTEQSSLFFELYFLLWWYRRHATIKNNNRWRTVFIFTMKIDKKVESQVCISASQLWIVIADCKSPWLGDGVRSMAEVCVCS